MIAPPQHAAPRRFPWTALILGIVGIAILVSLGAWQVERLAWKEGLLAAIDQRIHSAPRPLVDIERQFAEAGDVEYWPWTMPGSGISWPLTTASPASLSTRR
jgi:surfeit locus 1 family protein